MFHFFLRCLKLIFLCFNNFLYLICYVLIIVKTLLCFFKTNLKFYLKNNVNLIGEAVMRNKIINFLILKIQNTNHYNPDKLGEIKYGLESLYLTITKLSIIILIAYFLNILYELFMFLIFYNTIRSVSFGLHAKKSWVCLISSVIIFICSSLICKYIVFSLPSKYIIIAISFYLFWKYAPADTKKRPIVNKRRKSILKLLSLLIVFIYAILSIILNDNFLCNCLLESLILQGFLISPLGYKLFGLDYNRKEVIS